MVHLIKYGHHFFEIILLTPYIEKYSSIHNINLHIIFKIRKKRKLDIKWYNKLRGLLYTTICIHEFEY